MGKKREIARGLAGNIDLLLNRPTMPVEDMGEKVRKPCL